MSTRSYVMMQVNENDVKGVYVHFDGMPSVRLPLLNSHYDTSDKVEALISLGNLSYINETEVCAYHRDRGESWESNKPITILRSRAKTMLDDVDYVYIFTLEGKWVYLG